MFSVIIPLYNKEYYISKSINSVLKQTFKNFELIIINDGSTDDSLSIVQQFTDTRIKIVNQENSGVSVTRNNGVKLAKYEHIAFLDADDWWNSHFLEEMDKLVTNYPDAGLYGCKYYLVKNSNLIESNIGIPSDFLAGYINYFQVYSKTFWVPINCSFVIIKKTVFNEVGSFDANLKFGEDFHLWVRVALKYQVAYLNKCLAYSNQDVSVSNRALGNTQRYLPTTHFIFNLDFLDLDETNNTDLKYLLDGLKVRSLLDFYLNKFYPLETQKVLAQVNFKKQPFFYSFIYKFPFVIVKCFFSLKKVGSKVKQFIITKL